MTVKEIAQICNVSTATVSNILNGKNKASEDTVKRVMEVVEKYNYKPNPIAQGLRTKKTKTIGILVEDMAQFTSPDLLEGVMEVLEQSEYRVLVENLRLYARWGNRWHDKLPEFKEYVDMAIEEFKSLQIDGAIYVAGHTRLIEGFAEKIDVPSVITHAYSSDAKTPGVMIDDFRGAYDMVRYMIRCGHRKIAFIGGMEDNLHTVRRLEGYKKALYEAGIEYNDKLVTYGRWIRETGYTCMETLIDKDITAVFCCNDLMSGGVYDSLIRHGKRAGKDISIGGFDGMIIAEFFQPGLTTMAVDLGLMGRIAADELVKKIENPENYSKEDIYVTPKLIERDSVCKI